MVRIIFSGTYSGFSTWYDSDRNYSRRGDNDPAARLLLDRGQYLYRGNGRLYRKGYSIQPVCSEGAVGVFYHKIMLLSDFFGRGQGFVTVSLFLPKDKFLMGSIIRQALDELVSHYEMLADTGKAVIEIDWSFVDRKAEELNRIETDRVWNTLPPDKPSPSPALLRGLEPGDIDIYFTYPNPLFGILPNFEQVFLTEELLSDETTGYSVILKKDADPTNPDISIPRPSDYNCNVLEWKAERMKKKTLEAELKANGGQLCWGKVSRPGYRAGEVWLTNEDLKKLDDRYEIRLSSPSLNMMEAMVTLQLMDKKQNQPISEEKIGDFTFEWSCLSVTAKPEKQGVTSFRFKGEQCENKAWTVKVSHSSYRQTVETIMVSDDITPINHSIVMEPKKVIVISVNAPDSYKRMVQNEYVVYEDEKDRTIENIVEKFKKFEDELQVDVLDKGNGMVQVEVKERPRPTVWKILAVTEESVNSNVAETEYNGDDLIKLSKEIIRFKEKLKKELLWKVKLKENGEEDVINDIKKKQVIIKVVRMPKPPIVTPPLDPISETDQSETVTTPIHPSNGTTTAPDATTTMSDDKTEEDKPKEKPRTFYIPLDDGSRNFPLFKNYKTSVQVQEAIKDLRTQSEGVKEDDSKLAQTIAEGLDNGDTNYALKLTKSFSNEPQGKRLREIAKKAIHTKNHSYVVEGNDSVRYDRDNHCLTWEGFLCQRSDPTTLRLKKYEKHHYEFEVPPQWQETLDGNQRYKVNKITDKKDFGWLLEQFRTRLPLKIVAFVVGTLAFIGICVTVINAFNKENPIKLISILPSCSRVISPDQPPQNDEEEAQDVVEESHEQNEIPQEEIEQYTEDGGVSVVDSLIIVAQNKDTACWGKLEKSLKYPSNYSDYLKAMKTHIESINDSAQKLKVRTSLIKTKDSHIVLAMRNMDESTGEYMNQRKISKTDPYYGENSPFFYFLDCLDEGRQNWYKGLWGSTPFSSTSGTSSSSSGTSSTSRASSSSSGTSSTPGASSPSTVTQGQGGQGKQDNESMGSGTEESSNDGTKMQQQEEKIIVNNITDLWNACNSLEVVMDYEERINFNQPNTKDNLNKTISDLRNAIRNTSLDANTYGQYYNDVNNDDSPAINKFVRLKNKINPNQ